MTLAPRTPVIVGVGQVTERPAGEGDGQLATRAEPATLMARAVEAAAADADGRTPGAAGGPGRRLLGQRPSLRVVTTLSWDYLDPGRLVAEGAGLEPSDVLVTTTGGDQPVQLLCATALAVARGELDVAVLVGGECGFTRTAARRHPDRPVLPWTVQPVDVVPPARFGADRAPTTPFEAGRGLGGTGRVFPLFENALRAAAGRGLEDHRDRLGRRWAAMARVAADNPWAWTRDAPDAGTITTPGPDNPLVTYPYTRWLTADLEVDQAAALIVCSAAAARAAGIPRDRWVFPWAGARADDHWFLSHRADFTSSPALRLAGGAALGLSGRSAADVEVVDLDACSPAAVEIAACELGLDPDDLLHPPTVTGGATFAGAPGSNTATHAVAATVAALRERADAAGLVTGIGWYLTRHAVVVLGTTPRSPTPAGAAGLPAGTDVVTGDGFALADPQAAVGALPQVASDADATGPVTVETSSVAYDAQGDPARGVVACRTPEGRRTWGVTTDPDVLEALVTTETAGRAAVLAADGRLDLVGEAG